MPDPKHEQPPGAPAPTTSGGGPAEPVPLEPPKVPIADLPWAYDDDRLVLLTRDPRTLFCYWDFHPATVAAAGEGQPMLRLHGLSRGEPQVLREVPVDLAWKAYYFFDCEPNRDYRVEVFLRTAQGDRRLGRPSNVATLPPNAPSNWVEDRFITLGLDVSLPLPGLPEAFADEGERQLHRRAWELSGGEAFATGDEAGSSVAGIKGFGGRAWSGSLVRSDR